MTQCLEAASDGSLNLVREREREREREGIKAVVLQTNRYDYRKEWEQ
jgi:hypothetical protein